MGFTVYAQQTQATEKESWDKSNFFIENLILGQSWKMTFYAVFSK